MMCTNEISKKGLDEDFFAYSGILGDQLAELSIVAG